MNQKIEKLVAAGVISGLSLGVFATRLSSGESYGLANNKVAARSLEAVPEKQLETSTTFLVQTAPSTSELPPVSPEPELQTAIDIYMVPKFAANTDTSDLSLVAVMPSENSDQVYMVVSQKNAPDYATSFVASLKPDKSEVTASAAFFGKTKDVTNWQTIQGKAMFDGTIGHAETAGFKVINFPLDENADYTQAFNDMSKVNSELWGSQLNLNGNPKDNFINR